MNKLLGIGAVIVAVVWVWPRIRGSAQVTYGPAAVPNVYQNYAVPPPAQNYPQFTQQQPQQQWQQQRPAGNGGGGGGGGGAGGIGGSGIGFGDLINGAKSVYGFLDNQGAFDVEDYSGGGGWSDPVFDVGSDSSSGDYGDSFSDFGGGDGDWV